MSENHNSNVEFTSNKDQHLKRSLKARHMNMIALGGAIGTGLFVAGGEVVSTAGPGGALVAYGLIGIMVYFLMTSLGEMATYLPIPGSFGTYAKRYVDPAFGFALGWNYWFNWAITLAAEVLAGALIMKYWFPDVPAIVWSALFLLILFGLNYLSTRSFGESEYVFSSIKVITVFVFLFCGFMLIFGIGGTSPGFANWTVGEAPFVGGWESILAIFMVAGFSFQGTELIGVAAGEAEDPEKNVPKAINTIFWRILLFYIVAFTVIGFLIPYTDPNLLNSSVENVSISPFTLVFDRFGFAFAASFINAIILTAVLSAGNSGLYSSTRMLYALAKEGQAPQIFAKLNKRGVPVPALILTTAIGLFAFLTSFIGEGTAIHGLLISLVYVVSSHGLVSPCLTIVSAVLSSHKAEILVNCHTKRGYSQLAQSWRSFFASLSSVVKTTPLSQAILSTGTAYPLPTLAYQSSSQCTLVTNTSTKLKLCR